MVSTCFVFGFAGISESFSDMAQNITSAQYKRAVSISRGGGGGWWAQVTFRHNGTSCAPKEPSHVSQTTLQSKAGHLVTVMGDWEQLHTIAILLKPAKHSHSLFRVVWKSRPS